MNEFLGA